MKTLTDIGFGMVSILHKRKGVVEPRYRGGLLSWLKDDKGWLTPVWTHVTFYSSSNDIVRFRNDLLTKLPKSQWCHRNPDQFRFELTAMIPELDEHLLEEVIDYCELARRQPKAKFDRHPPRFPRGADHGGYGWTTKAWETQNDRNKNG